MFHIELAIAKILINGLDEIRQDPAIMDQVFLMDQIEELFGPNELANAKDYIIKNRIPVRLSYPRDHAELPCFSVTLGDFSEEKMLGDRMVTEDRPGKRVAVKGGHYLKSFKVASWAKSSTALAILLFYLSHYMLFMNKGFLMSVGAMDINFSGRDLEPAEQFYPEFVYTRPLFLNLIAPTYFEAGFEDKRTVTVITGEFSNG